MIMVKEIEKKTMTSEKRASAKNDLFAFYVGRPISYVLTIPFLYTNISPNAVSIISIIPVIAGTILMYLGESKITLVVGWVMFFLWNLLDGVDGNIARYKKQFSSMGSVYDAMSGYVAMILSFFAWGIAASHNPGKLQQFISMPEDIYTVLGALSGIFVIFPRFIMHKVISTLGNENSMKKVKDKSEYGFGKLIALNLVSISGFVQILMLISVLSCTMDLFTVFYFILNLLIMIISLISILKE